MKKFIFLTVFLVSASCTFAQMRGRIDLDVIIGNRQPNDRERKLMQAEERAHPNIAKTMHDIENGLQHLQEAPDDFGGHKAQAQADLKQAWISLRKALYYRTYEDGDRDHHDHH